ncbi:fatty-acid-CoA ligase [Mycobacterium liflandii 128FXT]|uniref:Fatty-acid-CoA ligase n=1 Tax=Mycobacterium liflandii (strain 128FXT) TaxID=459424 RepID=L7V4B7_MYCL1|nr:MULTISPECIES: AMP-binding protein [Mycobacterium ulcerans group]AGC61012.1 fatty-acid-CoA ligase [Mycobacterium liflandii 128FXT]ULL09509.1 malonyl-CoA synthase [Mycobacterium liflandii]
MTFQPIHRSFHDRASERPDATLFHLPDGREITYATTAETAQRIAARLLTHGVTPGDRVAMQVDKSWEAIALYLAVLQIGAVFLPLNTAYTSHEMDHFLSDAQPRVLVCSPRRFGEYRSSAGDSLVLESLGANGDGTLLREAGGTAPRTTGHDVRPPDAAAMLYTSGTTGRPKGAVLTHGNLASNCAALTAAWRFTADDRLIHALPIFHIHGLFVAMNLTLTSGACVHYLSKFDLDTIIELLPYATVLMGVPTFYTRLLADDRLDSNRVRSMRLFVSGSAPLLASDHEAFYARTGRAILERYGMTETCMTTSNPYEGTRKPGTVGRPLPGIQVRVVNRETGAPLPDGEVGGIEVRGPNVFAGYWKLPKMTDTEFREDGYFITGDVGRIDEDGYLVIIGRDKDLIISGGFNVYPKEIEELIDAHPDVLESAVIGVPHPDLGETVVAVVVPQPTSAPDGESILAFIAPDLARFKQPRAIKIVAALPRNAMGKVQKAALRNKHQGLFAT